MIGNDPSYLSLSLEELYDRLYVCEKKLILETDPLDVIKFKEYRQFIRELLASRLDVVERCKLKSALNLRFTQIEDLLKLIYECLNKLDDNQFLAEPGIQRYKNDTQLQGIQEWLTEFEQEYNQTQATISTLPDLLQPAIDHPAAFSAHPMAKIDYAVLKYEIRQYFARKALDACEKQENSYGDTIPPHHLHFFKLEQRYEIARLDRNLKEARKSKTGPTYIISLDKLKAVFYDWLEEEQISFVKECTDIGIDPGIFEISDVTIKTEKLASRCQESPVVLRRLLYYSLQEGYQLNDFIVNEAILLSA